MYKFKVSAARSNLMRKIRSSKTSPEIYLQRILKKEKIKFKSYSNDLLGKPDIVLHKNKVVIFIDGEFWHGYKWKEKRQRIKANRNYWIPKIEKNIERDKRNNKILKLTGWKVIRFWEHEINKDLKRCVEKIKTTAKS